MSTVTVLSPVEGAAWADQVLLARRRWRRQSTELPAFSLGEPAYLQAGPMDSYMSRARDDRRWLGEMFGDLYEIVRLALCDVIGDIEWHPRLALPGFHIFEPCWQFTHPSLAMHRDLQLSKLSVWPESPGQYSSELSFTLPLQLPLGGGGLTSWRHLGDARSLGQCDGLRNRLHHEYVVGEVFVHDGSEIHQINAMKVEALARPDLRRITFQGHAFESQGRWLCYW